MTRLAVSSWSLHRTLGPVYEGAPDDLPPRTRRVPYGPGECDLLDLPELVAGLGIHRLEICHFHFPRTDRAYLDSLREALAAAGVRFSTLLIDEGDPSQADPGGRERDLSQIRGWIDIAATVGAERVRVIAGDAEAGAEAAGRSTDALRDLAGYAGERGVQVITENWHRLALDVAALLSILDGLKGRVGLCVDFGNARGADKYQALARMLPGATTVHAKPNFTGAGAFDEEDFSRCLRLTREAGFDGDFVVIFDGPGEEREGISQVARYITAA